MRKLLPWLSIVLPLVCLLLSGHQGMAQTINSARITWYGVYTAKTTTSESATKTISTGVRGPAVNSDHVPFDHTDSRFGYGFRLYGSPPSAQVALTYRTIFPNHQVQDNVYRQLAMNRDDLFIGQLLNSDSDTGLYILQVWHNGKMILEKSFTVGSD